eukprot:3632268-Amphidinium_carterae.1
MRTELSFSLPAVHADRTWRSATSQLPAEHSNYDSVYHRLRDVPPPRFLQLHWATLTTLLSQTEQDKMVMWEPGSPSA